MHHFILFFLLYLTIMKQSLYSAMTILKQSDSPEGHRLLCLISSYLQLDSYIGLDVHTTSTLDAIEAKLPVFNDALKVGSFSFTKTEADSSFLNLTPGLCAVRCRIFY
jgi:hypothetical protein